MAVWVGDMQKMGDTGGDKRVLGVWREAMGSERLLSCHTSLSLVSPSLPLPFPLCPPTTSSAPSSASLHVASHWDLGLSQGSCSNVMQVIQKKDNLQEAWSWVWQESWGTVEATHGAGEWQAGPQRQEQESQQSHSLQ